MSTHLYLRCVSHTPYLESDEVGHNTSFLDEIREDVRDKEKLIAVLNAVEVGNPFDYDWRKSVRVRFLRDHPNCKLELWDEYGRQYDLQGELVHGVNFFDDEIPCEANRYEGVIRVSLDTDFITCQKCQDALIRKD